MNEENQGCGAIQDSVKEHASAPDYEEKYKEAMVGLGDSWGSTDLRAYSPERHDQGGSSTCVTNAVLRGVEIKRIVNRAEKSGSSIKKVIEEQHVPLSRASLYYLCRENTVPDMTDEDSGTRISLAAEMMSIYGVCPEVEIPGRPKEFWPFSTSLVHLCTPPTWMAMRNAASHKIDAWAKIKSSGYDLIEDLKANLMVRNPIAWATSVDSQWSGHRKEPIDVSKGDIRGMHATLIVGWDPNLCGGVFLIENSWGAGWGEGGFGMATPEKIIRDGVDFVVLEDGWEDWSPKFSPVTD